MRDPSSKLPVLCIGAGIGGLSAALRLAVQGHRVLLLDAGDQVGGKAGQRLLGGQAVGTGPSVLTMVEVFADLFAAAGADFYADLRPRRLQTLAQHYFPDGTHLALHQDLAASRDAVGAFAGATAAREFSAFMAYAQKIYDTVRGPFMAQAKPTPASIWRQHGWRAFAMLPKLDAQRSVARAVASFFTDPRLRQLFGRYATYSGGSPYRTPATFNLIAHVEQRGVWALPGGMHQLPLSLAGLLQRHGGQLRLRTAVQGLQRDGEGGWLAQLGDGERVRGSAVVLCGSPRQLRQLLRPAAQRPKALPLALSGVTWTALATVEQDNAATAPLAHHNVFFGDDPQAEFAAIFGRRAICDRPTVYLCAGDRQGEGGSSAAQGDSDATVGARPQLPGARPERIFCLINAPSAVPGAQALEPHLCRQRILNQLQRCGLRLQPQEEAGVVLPSDFAARFAASAGAIYGAPPHSWASAFLRPGSRGPLPGLYLCGGDVHPGPGVPMAALSGRWAAEALAADCPSTSSFPSAAMPGGTSTPKATTAKKP